VSLLPPGTALADPHRDEHARHRDDHERLDDRADEAAVRN
jgi:hypothetical protein